MKSTEPSTCDVSCTQHSPVVTAKLTVYEGPGTVYVACEPDTDEGTAVIDGGTVVVVLPLPAAPREAAFGTDAAVRWEGGEELVA